MMRDQERADAAKTAYVAGLIDTVAHPVVRVTHQEVAPSPPAAPAPEPPEAEPLILEAAPISQADEVFVREIPGVAVIAAAPLAEPIAITHETTPVPAVVEAELESVVTDAPLTLETSPAPNAAPQTSLGQRLGALFGRGARRGQTTPPNE